jgi:hypothetical protein
MHIDEQGLSGLQLTQHELFTLRKNSQTRFNFPKAECNEPVLIQLEQLCVLIR